MLKVPLIKPSHLGLFHKDTGTPGGEKIPYKDILEKEHSKNAAERKRAVFAANTREWNHGK